MGTVRGLLQGRRVAVAAGLAALAVGGTTLAATTGASALACDDNGLRGVFNWRPSGESLDVGDHCADGHPVKGRVFVRVDGEWRRTDITATARGNGNWAHDSTPNLAEGRRIKIRMSLEGGCVKDWTMSNGQNLSTSGTGVYIREYRC